MKGIILAGGTGSRLKPITNVTNKHLLPVYNKPMIYYPIETMKACGFEELLIVTGKEHAGHFLNVLGGGEALGLKLFFEVQDKAGGIAEALSLARDYAKGQSVAVCLGDNIFENHSPLTKGVKAFQKTDKGGKIFLKEVKDPERFGVAHIEAGKVTEIIEKPDKPKTNLIVTGFYIYDSDVFEIITKQKPSGRGEFEITDVNNAYVKKGLMTYEKIEGEWTDAGTFESLYKASELIRGKQQ